MRQLRAIVCLVYCVSFMLAPGSMLHAHVALDEHDHSHVHGGHSHELAIPDADIHDHETHVVELNTAPDHGANTLWLSWVALPIVLFFIFVCSVCIAFVPRERRREARSPNQFPPWPPPLRGPPLSI